MSHTKKITSLAFLLLQAGILFFASAQAAMAQWRTADEALQLAQQAAGSGGKPTNRVNAMKPSLAYVMPHEGNPAVYVFDRPGNGGSVFVSGHEQATPILGYTDCGHFVADSVPTALRNLLQQYARQMAAYAPTGHDDDARTAALKAKADWKAVPHLVQTRWNQYAPYDLYCPKGTPTGCVATMTAQIMKYYNYPAKGSGSHSYYWNGQTRSANFGTTTYHWERMLDSYNGSYTQEQAHEVGQLMSHIGVMVEMNYAEDGSGASVDMAMQGLKEYFNYNANAHYENRDNYKGDWEELLYGQVSQGYPVMYSGSGSGGHAFILDGYKDGLWAVNWGWGGSYDGYFALDAMTPGSSHNYSYGQSAVIDMYPTGSYTLATDEAITLHDVDPGTLKSLLGSKRYSSITLTGKLNGADIRELRARMASIDYNYAPTVQGLRELDLGGAEIVSGGIYMQEYNSEKNTLSSYEAEANRLSYLMFGPSPFLQKLVLPSSVKVMDSYSIYSLNALESLTLPAALETFNAGAISYCTSLGSNIICPPGCAFTMKDGMLYSSDFSALMGSFTDSETIVLDPRCRRVSDDVFYRMTGEKNVWLGNVSTIGGYALPWKGSTSFYITSVEVPTLGYQYTQDFNGSIYVRRELLTEYRQADNWSQLAAFLKSIDEAGFVADEHRVAAMPPLDIYLGDQTMLQPVLMDTKLFGKSVTWTVSDGSILSLDSHGLATALREGTVTVRAMVDGLVSEGVVTVKPWPAVNVATPGTLASLLAGQQLTYLRVSGNINGEDIRELRGRMSAYDYGYEASGSGLTVLDLSEANIVSGGIYYQSLSNGEVSSYEAQENTISYDMFYGSTTLTRLILPRSVRVMASYGVSNMYALQSLTLPEKLQSYNVGVNSCSSLTEVIAPSGLFTVVDGMLYSSDYRTLYYAFLEKDEVLVDPRCKEIASHAFYSWKRDSKIWLGDVSTVGSYALPYSSSSCIYITSAQAPTLGYQYTGYFTGTIFVPRAIIPDLTSTSNGAALADFLKPIESTVYVADERGLADIPAMQLYVGDKASIPLPVLDTRLVGKPVEWSVADDSVLSFDSDGNVFARGEGKTIVVARVEGKEATGEVEVVSWPVICVETPGTLASLVEDKHFTHLAVAGDIDGDDVHELRRMLGSLDISGGYYTTIGDEEKICKLDLTNANIVSGGAYLYWDDDRYPTSDNEMGRDFINYASYLEELRLPATVMTMSYLALYRNSLLQTLELPADLITIYYSALSNNTELTTVIYRGDNIPTVLSYDGSSKVGNATLYVRADRLSAIRSSNFGRMFWEVLPLDMLPTEFDYIPASPDGISLPQAPTQAHPAATDAPAYDITGRRVNSATAPALYIIQGRKVLVR